MFTRCLVCASPFEENEFFEHLPRGRRVAFDPGKGRLWIVCRNCRRWSLVPMEARWEALEELERAVRDGGHLLSSTDNIALFRVGPMEVVRVGAARRTEEAWWRYGRELATRRDRYRKLSLAGTAAAGALVVGGWASGGVTLLGMWFVMENAPQALTSAARWLRFGSAAWRGRKRCPRCGTPLTHLPFRDRTAVGIVPRQEGEEVALWAPCPTCSTYRDGGLRLEGMEAERTLRRILAYHHFRGASERRVRASTRLIEEAGSPGELSRILLRRGRRLGDLPRTGAIALEIAANEEAEQRLLEMELAELEARWRTEEELAAIIDGELTPLPLLESLRRKVVEP
ncbi:MAG: hypothetical protein ACE5GJ_03910 [Gemmatimonadota bacterium]